MSEELSERSLAGGRPMTLGQLLIKDDTQTDLSMIREECVRRYHLGFCPKCNTRLVVGQNRADEMVKYFARRGFRSQERSTPFRVRLAKYLLKSYPQQGT